MDSLSRMNPTVDEVPVLSLTDGAELHINCFRNSSAKSELYRQPLSSGPEPRYLSYAALPSQNVMSLSRNSCQDM
jgi:hypothetical protein